MVQGAPLTLIVPCPLHQVPPTFPYCGPPAGGATGTTGTTGTNPAGETGAGTPESETTVTDVSGKTGGRIETGVTPSENTADTDSGSGLSWLWWVIPLVLCGGVVLWLVLGKKHEGDEDEE